MKNVRHDLGFTQEELAILLGVSRGLISLYDKGLRSLPAKALEKLSLIQLLLNEVEKQKTEPCRKLLALQQKHRKRAQDMLHKHAKKAAVQAARLSMEIAATRERFRQMEHKLGVIQVLIEQVQAGSREWKVLSNLQERLLHAIDVCNPSSEYACTYRLAMLITRQQVAMDMHQKLQRKDKH
jgi:transcriptional regulator with XRE-family HTH domain